MSAVHGMMLTYPLDFYMRADVENYYMGICKRVGEDKAFLLH